MMTINDLLDQGIEFQSEVRLCYYDYDKDERVVVNDDPEMYQRCSEEPIRYIYADKEHNEEGERVIYIEVRKPDEENEPSKPDFEDLYGAHGEYEDDYKIQMKNKYQEVK